MKAIEENVKELLHISNRHNTFKKIFNTFQKAIENLELETFPVKGVIVENVSDEKTIISFISRKYKLNFSSCTVGGSLKGKISASRILDEENIHEIASITYNGQSEVDLEPPPGEDPIRLNEDSCCFNLVLNWLSSEINA